MDESASEETNDSASGELEAEGLEAAAIRENIMPALNPKPACSPPAGVIPRAQGASADCLPPVGILAQPSPLHLKQSHASFLEETLESLFPPRKRYCPESVNTSATQWMEASKLSLSILHIFELTRLVVNFYTRGIPWAPLSVR